MPHVLASGGLPAKLCVHPAQVGALYDALRPDPDLLELQAMAHVASEV